MKNIIPHFRWIPEFYFILVSLLWFYISVQNQNTNFQSVINFPAILLIVLLHIQLFLNDYYLSKILAIVLALGSVYLLLNGSLNLIDFKNFDYNSKILALKLGNLLLLNLIMAVWMFFKLERPAVEPEAEFSE